MSALTCDDGVVEDLTSSFSFVPSMSSVCSCRKPKEIFQSELLTFAAVFVQSLSFINLGIAANAVVHAGLTIEDNQSISLVNRALVQEQRANPTARSASNFTFRSFHKRTKQERKERGVL